MASSALRNLVADVQPQVPIQRTLLRTLLQQLSAPSVQRKTQDSVILVLSYVFDLHVDGENFARMRSRRWSILSNSYLSCELASHFSIANDAHPCIDVGLDRGELQDKVSTLVHSHPKVHDVKWCGRYSRFPHWPFDLIISSFHVANVVEGRSTVLQDLIEGHLRPFALFVKRAGDIAIFALPLVLREILLGDADLARYKDTIHI